jgi:hypothetical protein
MNEIARVHAMLTTERRNILPPRQTVIAGCIRRMVRQNHSAGSVGGCNRPAGSCLRYSVCHSLCFSCGASGRSVGRRAAGRREQVGIETDTGLFYVHVVV